MVRRFLGHTTSDLRLCCFLGWSVKDRCDPIFTPAQSSQGKFPCACSLPSRAPPCCLVRACGVRCRGVLSRSSPQGVITCSHHWERFLYSALERWSQLAGLMAKRDDRTRCSYFFTTNGGESDSKSDYLPACCENPAARSESLDRKDGLTGNQT